MTQKEINKQTELTNYHYKAGYQDGLIQGRVEGIRGQEDKQEYKDSAEIKMAQFKLELTKQKVIAINHLTECVKIITDDL